MDRPRVSLLLLLLVAAVCAVRALPGTGAALEMVNSAHCYATHDGAPYWEALMAHLAPGDATNVAALAARVTLLNAGLLSRPPRAALLTALADRRLDAAARAALPSGPALPGAHPLLVCLRGARRPAQIVATMDALTEMGRAANAALAATAEAAMVFDAATLDAVYQVQLEQVAKKKKK